MIPLTQPIDFTLNGRVAIVTGAGSGIGRGIALGLAHAGANLVVAGRTAETLEAVGNEVGKIGRKLLAVPADVTDSGDIEVVVRRALETFGRIDILVNNAGGGGGLGQKFRRAPLLDTSEAEMLATFALNFNSVVLLSRAVVPAMQAQGGGSIVNVASMAGRDHDHPMPGSGMYGAAKAAVVNISRTMAVEWAPEVRVNCVSPGMITIDSPRVTAIRSPERTQSMMATIAMGRGGLPEDVAGAVVYLASDAAKWVTGAVIDIHGGLKSSWLPAPVVKV